VRAIKLVLSLVLFLPGLANAQSLEVYGAAGPTLKDAGNSVAIGAGFSPHSRITLLFNFERTHLSTRISTDDHGVTSRFRGGTLLLGSAELRIVPFGRHRLGPYGFVGLAKGVSRPNVNADFPNRITNDVTAGFAGGGLQIPLGEKVVLFGDVRMTLGAEGVEGIVAVVPLRAGIAIRF
jgi:hypothetical protein